MLRQTPVEGYIAEHIDRQLNFSAQTISLLLAENANAPINYGRGAYTFVTDGILQDFPLYNVADLHSPRDLAGSATTNFCGRQIKEREAGPMRAKYPCGKDQEGKYLYHVTYSPNETYRLTITATDGTFTMTYNGGTASAAQSHDVSAAALQTVLEGLTGVGSDNVTVTSSVAGTYVISFAGSLGSMGTGGLTVNGAALVGGTATLEQYRYTISFLKVLDAGLTFSFIYNLLVPEIPTGAAGDDLGFTVVPAQYHEAIVEHTVAMLSGHANAPQTQFATAIASQMGQGAVENAARAISPFQMKT